MEEIRTVLTIYPDTQCDGKKRRIMCITQKDHNDIIAVRMPLLDHYLCSRLLRHADYLLTFLFSSKVLRALTPSGHNDPVCWDDDNCDKKTRNMFFTNLLHEIELVNRMSDD